MEKKGKSTSKLTFEKAIKELEDITKHLEDGELGLDESIAAFEKGIKLAKFCYERLEDAERKIEILQKSKDETITKKSVKVNDDKGEFEDDDEVQGSLL